MVDGDERKPARPRDHRRGEADEQRADQSGALGDGEPVDVVQHDLRLAERLTDHGRHELEMPPRRDLRHDAAVLRVQIDLRRDDIREDLPLLGDHGRRGLVAARLEAEDHS